MKSGIIAGLGGEERLSDSHFGVEVLSLGWDFYALASWASVLVLGR